MTSKYLCLIQDNASKLILSAAKSYNHQVEFVNWRYIQDNPHLKSDVVGAVVWNKISEDWKINELQNLKVISNHGVGIEHLDIPEIRQRNIRICNTPVVVGPATAEIAFGLMIASARRFKEAITRLHIQHGGNDSINGFQVSGSSIGIVGLGSVGSEIAKRALAFDMTIYYHQRSRNTHKESIYTATYCPTLSDLLPRCDFLILSCPYYPQTHHMISREQFQLMKRGAFIINVGRGALINTDDLIEALKNGQLRGAGLDVTDPEPLPQDHPLMALPNVFITPHLGVNTMQTRIKMAELTVSNLLMGLEGKKLDFEA